MLFDCSSFISKRHSNFRKSYIRVFLFSRDDVDDMALEQEIDKLLTLGVKNRAHTLNLCRLMVRAEDIESRRNILNVLRNAEQACRYSFGLLWKVD